VVYDDELNRREVQELNPDHLSGKVIACCAVKLRRRTSLANRSVDSWKDLGMCPLSKSRTNGSVLVILK